MNKLFIVLGLLLSGITHAAIGEADRQELVIRNILQNPGFENGKFAWSASGGTFSITTSAASVAYGNSAASWDSSGAAQTFQNGVVIPPGLYGRNATLSCLVKTASGTATHTLAAYDGSNTLASQTVVSSSTYAKTEVNFIMPSSGTIYTRFSSVAADEPAILVDQCAISAASNISNVSQAQFVGSAYFETTGSCTWTRASASLGAFSTTAACPGPTVDLNPMGLIQTTDSDLPKVTVNNVPPGYYQVCFNGDGDNSASENTVVTIYDGTTSSGLRAYGGTGTTSPASFTVCGNFSYTTAANRSYELYASTSAAATFTIRNATANRRTSFQMFKYPSTSEVAYNPSQTPSYWAGYHDNTCNWTRTNSALGAPTDDASCALVQPATTNINFGTVSTSGSVSPAITFTPKVAGLFKVCALTMAKGSASGTNITARLTDGTTTLVDSQVNANATAVVTSIPLCGLYSATSTASVTFSIQTAESSGTVTLGADSSVSRSSIEWSILQISPQFSNPQIVNAVVSPSSGGVRIGTAKLTNSGSCAISTQDGNWISSVNRTEAGTCAVTIAASMFSVAPVCTCTCADTAASVISCGLRAEPTTTSVSPRCMNNAGSGTDQNIYISCTGAK